LNKVCLFLGIEKMSNVIYEKSHVGDYEAVMSDVERAYLKDKLEIEIRALEKMLGWDCTNWIA